MTQQPLVVIRCITYNHEKYIRDTLNGFLIQRTDFPFVAIVHDDASTDSTADIIREYADKYPHIIKPLFETENQFSKRDGSLRKIMNQATNELGPKYVACCEGDDYWSDPLKLQKQVDFLESNPDYNMVATNCQYLKGTELTPGRWNVENECDARFEDVVRNGGNYLITPSIIMRYDTYKGIPAEVTSQYVGDYPLQIYFAYVGKIRILKDITCVYRVMAEGSWSAKSFRNKTRESVIKRIHNEHKLLDAMDKVTGYSYHKLFLEQKDIYKYIDIYGFNKPFECLPIYFRRYKAIIRKKGYKYMFYRFFTEETPWLHMIYKKFKSIGN